MKEVTLAIKNIQWADGPMTLFREDMEERNLPVEAVLTVKVGDDDLMARTMEAVLYSLTEKYGQPDDGIEAVDFDVDWSNSAMDDKEPQNQASTEPTISIAQEDWKLLLRYAWRAALDTRSTALSLLIVRDQLKTPEGRLTRISLLGTSCLEFMLEEIEIERKAIEQCAKPAFFPRSAEILEEVENVIQCELARRTDEKDGEGPDEIRM